MRAAVYGGPGKLTLQDVPDPVPGPDEILIEIAVSLVCGSDLKTYRSGHPGFQPGDILGHEFSGVVVVAGERVTTCAVGDRVVVAPFVGCGSCFFCTRGDGDLCRERLFISNGAFAQYTKVTDLHARRGLHRLAADASFEQAAFVEPLACVVNALDDVPVRGGDLAVVIGAGPMGLLHALLLTRLGAARAIVAEPNEERRALAAALGATAVRPEQLAGTVAQHSDGRGADCVVLANAIPELVPEALAHVRAGGTLVLFGGFASGVTVDLDPNVVHYRKVRLTGGSGYSPAHFRRAFQLVESGTLPLERLVSNRFALERFDEGFAVALAQRGVKVRFDVASAA